MNVSANQLKSRPRKVGTRDGGNVMEVVTKGGYHIIVAPKGASFETLGVGPHRAVARHIAKKNNKGIQWLELSKSEDLLATDFQEIVVKYEGITASMRQLQGEDE